VSVSDRVPPCCWEVATVSVTGAGALVDDAGTAAVQAACVHAVMGVISVCLSRHVSVSVRVSFGNPWLLWS